MKKILFIAALGVAGFMSAESKPFHGFELGSLKNINLKDNKNKTENVKQEKIVIDNPKELITSMMFFYTWERVHSPCGQIYFLDLDQYTDDYNGLIAFNNDVAYFNAQKCNGNTGLSNGIVF